MHALEAPHVLVRYSFVALWSCGAIVVVALWRRSAGRLRAVVRSAPPLALEFPLPVRVTSSNIEPGAPAPQLNTGEIS